MLRAPRISFYKLMIAGFISAKAYRVLWKKKYLSQLTDSECKNFDPQLCDELEKLFKDTKTVENISYLDYIEHNIADKDNDLNSLLDYCTSDASDEITSTINQIGKKLFLLDYMFCTKECLKTKYLVCDDNIGSFLYIRQVYKLLLKDYIEKGTLPSRNNNGSCTEPLKNYHRTIAREHFGQYKAAARKDFCNKDIILIDDDALGSGNEYARKYVLYIYSMNYEDFEKFESFTMQVVSSCSARTCNCIKALGIRCFIINYLFADNIKLLNIRNVGRKSLTELVTIKPLIVDFIVEQYENGEASAVKEQIEKEHSHKSLPIKGRIDDEQYAILCKKLDALLANVSVRAQNGIKNYPGDFFEDIVQKGKDITSIRGLGRKSVTELQPIISQLQELLAKMLTREMSPDEAYWIEKTDIYGELIDDYCLAFYKENGHLPMFHMLENSLNLLLNGRHHRIFNDIIPFAIGKDGHTLEQVSQTYGLTKERIRQIIYKVIKELETLDESSLGTFTIKLLSGSQDWDYIKNKISNKALWDSSDLYEVVAHENCSLSTNILVFALSSVFSDTYSILGKHPLLFANRKSHWKNTYLIKKTILEFFDFDKMSEIIHEYEKNNSNSITLPIEELLNDTFYLAWKKYEYNIVDDLQKVVAEILIKEFSIIPDLDGKYTIQGLREEKVCDIIYEFIKSFGAPVNVDDLFTMFQIKYPNRYKSRNSLKSIIYSDIRMTFVGMSSLVSLTEWTHIQTGSIRDLIVAFLAVHKDPQHIKDIVAHVLAIRDTSERSISSTMDSGDQFVRFAGGYYGLADRTYSEWFNLSEAERSAREKIIEFEDFIKKEGRFPFYPSSNKDEEALNQWWARIKRHTEFTDTFLASIKNIDKMYSDLPRNKSELLWIEKCMEYKKFKETNGRKPSKMLSSEAALAKWFDKALDDIAEGKLSSAKESSFIKLCHSL